MIPVREPVMPEVVTHPCQQKRQYVDLVKLRYPLQVALSEEQMRHMRHIHPLQIVMILHVLFIGLIDFG